MAAIERYEDIQGWQKARELTNLVYAVTKQKAFARDFALKNQIQKIQSKPETRNPKLRI